MSTQIAPATIADLECHPGRCELINGEIVEMSPSGHGQGFVSANIASALIVHVRATKQGCQVLTNDPGFILDDQNVRAPDVAVISFEQVKAAPQRGYMRFVPRLAVEVVSPGDEWSEVKSKARMWLNHGVAMVWVVDPRSQTVEVYRQNAQAVELGMTDCLDGGDVIPGFSSLVSELFI